MGGVKEMSLFSKPEVANAWKESPCNNISLKETLFNLLKASGLKFGLIERIFD